MELPISDVGTRTQLTTGPMTRNVVLVSDMQCLPWRRGHMITPTAKHVVHHCRFPYGIGRAQRRQVVRRKHPSGSSSTIASSSRASPLRHWTYSIPVTTTAPPGCAAPLLYYACDAHAGPIGKPPGALHRGSRWSTAEILSQAGRACSHGRRSLILYPHIEYGHAKDASAVAKTNSPRIAYRITISHPPLHAYHVKEGSYGL